MPSPTGPPCSPPRAQPSAPWCWARWPTPLPAAAAPCGRRGGSVGRPTACLLGAIVAELGMLAAFLSIPPVADLLDQAPPSLAGVAVVLLAIPAVLAADALHKAAHNA